MKPRCAPTTSRSMTPRRSRGCAAPGGWPPSASTCSRPHVQPGVVTAELDRLAREFTLDNGALPACLYYRGYHHTLCISPNHVVCHGIPGERTLREGDIANIDVTLIVDGWHGDHSRMYAIGEVAPRARTAYRHHLRGPRTRSGAGQAWRATGRCRPRDPVVRRVPTLQRRARFLRPRLGPGVPRRPEHPAFRPAREAGEVLRAGDVLHDRADGEPRPPPGEAAE